MRRRRFLQQIAGAAVVAPIAFQSGVWVVADDRKGKPANTPSAAELRRLIASSSGRAGKSVKGKKGGSFQPVSLKGGKFVREGQHLGDLSLVNLKTRKTETHQVVVRFLDGKWSAFHLVGDKVLVMRNTKGRVATKGGRDWDWHIDVFPSPVPDIDVQINSDGSLTIELELGPVHIEYTTDPPKDSDTGVGGGSVQTYAY